MPRPPIRRVLGGALLGLLLTGGLGCQQDLVGTPPPQGVFYFPIGLALNDGGDVAYVVSSNFDQQFNSGWLSAVDLEAAVQSGEPVIDPVPKDGDELPGAFVDVVANQLKLPTLGGVVSRGGDFLYVAHRSDRLISIVEIDDPLDPACGDSDAVAGLSLAEQRTDCDRAHLFELTGDAAEDVSVSVDLTDFDVADPFSLQAVTLDGAEGPSSFLLNGQLSIPRLNAMVAIDSPQFLCLGRYANDERPNFDTGCFEAGASRAFGRSEVLVGAGRFNRLVPVPSAPGATESYNYLAAAGILVSGNEERAGLVHVDLDAFLSGAEAFSATYAIGGEVGGREIADLVFSPDGALAFAATRVTARTAGDSARGAVLRMDTTLEPIEIVNEVGEREIQRRPRYEVDVSTGLRGQPSGILYLERGALTDIVVVSDLDQDALFVLDAESAELPILGRIDVNGGPFSMTQTVLDGRDFVVVTLFYEHGLALVDVSSPDPVDFNVAHVIRNARLEPAERAR